MCMCIYIYMHVWKYTYVNVCIYMSIYVPTLSICNSYEALPQMLKVINLGIRHF